MDASFVVRTGQSMLVTQAVQAGAGVPGAHETVGPKGKAGPQGIVEKSGGEYEAVKSGYPSYETTVHSYNNESEEERA